MTAQANQEVGFHVKQNSSNMACRLKDITMMNLLMFYGPKVNEDPMIFLMMSTRLSMLWESSNKKLS